MLYVAFGSAEEAEFHAAQYAAEYMGLSGQVKMLSGGGQTCQVGFSEGDAPPRFISLDIGLNGFSKQLSPPRDAQLAPPDSSPAARQRVLKALQAHIAQEVKKTGKEGQLQGTFVVIFSRWRIYFALRFIICNI